MAVLTPRSVFRRYNVDGVPSSGSHKPIKDEIVQLLEQVFGVSRGGWVVTQTLAELNGVVPESETDGGVVLADPDPAKNGYYQRDGGVWVRGRGFPDTFARVALSGSGSAQTGVVQAGVNPADVEMFFAFVETDNTGSLTLAIGGEEPREVLNLAGQPLSAGEWTGAVMFALRDGRYQLLIDAGAAQAAAQSASDAKDEADRAEAAADRAENSASSFIEVATNFKTAVILLADETMGYAGSGKDVIVGEGDIVTAEGRRYEVVAIDATEYDEETAGGVKLLLRLKPLNVLPQSLTTEEKEQARANIGLLGPLSDRRVVHVVDGAIDASSGINASTRAHQQIFSFGGSQYTAYVKPSGQMVVATREHGSADWQTHDIAGVITGSMNAHWAPIMGIDENGRLIIAYNTRNSLPKWRYSAPEDITTWSAEQTGMTGENESSAGTPYMINGGETGEPLIFFYRQGSAANATYNTNVWDAEELTWSAQHHPLIDGTNENPSVSPYIWSPPYVVDGVIHIFWCWRRPGGINNNENMLYARSADGGATWTNSDDEPVSLPLSKSNGEIVEVIPPLSGLINLGHSAVGPDGTPHVAYLRNDAEGVLQIFHAFKMSGEWQVDQVSNRKHGYTIVDTAPITGPIARPGIEIYDDGSVLIFSRDYEHGNGLMFYYKQAQQSEWQMWTTGSENLVGWEPLWDKVHFRQTNQLDLLVAAVSDSDQSPQMSYRTPLWLWAFPSRFSIFQKYRPIIETVATTGKDNEGSYDRTVTAYGNVGPQLMLTPGAYDSRPTHVRFIGNCYEAAGGVAFRISRRPQNTETTPSFTFGEVLVNAVGGNVDIDTGWVEIPKFSNDMPIDFGAITLVSKSETGDNFRIRSWTLMLGAMTGAY